MSLHSFYWDRLTDDEQRSVLKAFRPRVDGDDDVCWELLPGTSGRAAAEAAGVLLKLGEMSDLPKPPAVADFRVLRCRQRGDKFEVLAAEAGSPVQGCLDGSTPESRKVQAIRAVERVEQFRREAPAWWFNVNIGLITD